jgi:peptide/nickel transport system substrate-binding protein
MNRSATPGARSVAALVLAGLALVAASGSSGRAGVPGASTGGTLVFAAEQEPQCLNLLLTRCAGSWGGYVETPVIRPAFLVLPNFTYKPDLVSSVRLRLHPMRLTYVIRQNAVWSDGRPVTGDDFVFTLRTIMNPKLDVAVRDGYDLITRWRVGGKARKVVTFTFSKPYADWKDLFSPYVLPSHALEGADMSTVWNDGIVNPKTGKPISDGPFTLTRWERGRSLTLVRSKRWYGTPARLGAIEFRFVADPAELTQALRRGTVDAGYPQPSAALLPLRSAKGVVYRTDRGTRFELLDLSELGTGDSNPLMRNVWVRQALIRATDRRTLVKDVFGRIAPGTPVFDNLIFASNAPGYEGHFAKWTYDPKKARQLLVAHGCRKGGDGIYVCGGTRLSFKVEWDTGNARRATVFAAIRNMWKQAGIEAVEDDKPQSIAFEQDLPSANYGVFLHAFAAPPDPAGATPVWSCPSKGGTQSYSRYCNLAVTAALRNADHTLRPDVRARLVDKADRLMADDVAGIPLWQLPTVLVYRSYVKGLTDDPTNQGFAWDAERWWLDAK